MTNIRQFKIQNQKKNIWGPENFLGGARPWAPICKSWIRHCSVGPVLLLPLGYTAV